jgi:hypothetical protein
MRRLSLAASGLGLSVLVSIAMANAPVAQDADAPAAKSAAFDPFGAPTLGSRDASTDAATAEAAVEEEKAADPETVLREEYLKLMQEKAALMDKAALEAALSAAQRDIQELEAENLLDEAKAILSRVADEYPTTGAAREADILIRHLNGTTPQPSSGEFRPL